VCLFHRSGTQTLGRSAQHPGSVKNARFEVHGLDPDAEVPVHFLEPHQKLGTTVKFSGKSGAGGSIDVQLEPCGIAKARLVDANHKPIAGYRGSRLISMVVAPDTSGFRSEQASLNIIDPINYTDGLVSDALGRIAFTALVPGAPYYLSVSGRTRTQRDKDFTVKPGETLDLGDILIEKPPS
jgi:hypothetical protein